MCHGIRQTRVGRYEPILKWFWVFVTFLGSQRRSFAKFFITTPFDRLCISIPLFLSQFFLQIFRNLIFEKSIQYNHEVSLDCHSRRSNLDLVIAYCSSRSCPGRFFGKLLLNLYLYLPYFEFSQVKLFSNFFLVCHSILRRDNRILFLCRRLQLLLLM
jgi:hypothetical protein